MLGAFPSMAVTTRSRSLVKIDTCVVPTDPTSSIYSYWLNCGDVANENTQNSASVAAASVETLLSAVTSTDLGVSTSIVANPTSKSSRAARLTPSASTLSSQATPSNQTGGGDALSAPSQIALGTVLPGIAVVVALIFGFNAWKKRSGIW